MEKLSKATILVVDDKPANILVLENLLAAKDRTFVNATNGKDALKVTLNKDIDLIILDVQMPDMDGFEVAQILKSNKRTKDIPIIFASAEKKEHKFMMKGYEEGAIDYLFKPLNPEIAKAKVAVFLKLQNAYKVLAESENKFKLITETINDVFYLYNIVEKKYEYISPNCNMLLGLDQQTIYELNTMKSAVYEPDLPLANAATAKIEQGIPYDIEFRVIVNGEIKWIAEKSSPIYDEKGNLVRNSGICRDVSSLKKANEQIGQLNIDLQSNIVQIEKKNEALNYLNLEKDRFMGMVSHDLKNHISAMLLTIRLMEKNTESSDESQSKYINRLRRSVVSMQRLLGDYLTVNRIQQGIVNPDYSIVDLAKQIGDMVEGYNDIATNKNLTLKFLNDCKDAFLETDPSYLGIIADNLISNAIKYSPIGGEIDILVSKSADKFCFEVKDQGAGLSASDIPKLYGRFQKLTPKPTAGEPSNGLGLSIVKDLVDALDATIECRSTEGKGTSFIVSF